MKMNLFTAPKANTIIFVAAVVFPVFSFICSDIEKTLSDSALMADIKNSFNENSYAQFSTAHNEPTEVTYEFLNASKN